MKIIDPKYWGPYTWYVIHTMAYSYESDKKVNYERILNSLKELNEKYVITLEDSNNFQRDIICARI